MEIKMKKVIGSFMVAVFVCAMSTIVLAGIDPTMYTLVDVDDDGYSGNPVKKYCLRKPCKKD